MQNLTGKCVFFFMLLIVFWSSGIWTSSSSKMPLLHFQRSQEEYDMKSESSDWICNILATYVWTLQQASRVLWFCTLETDSSPDVSVVQEDDALLLWWTDEKPSVSTA